MYVQSAYIFNKCAVLYTYWVTADHSDIPARRWPNFDPTADEDLYPESISFAISVGSEEVKAMGGLKSMAGSPDIITAANDLGMPQ